MLNFLTIAGAFDWGATRVEYTGDLDITLTVWLAHDGPYFPNFAVASTQNCFPMMPVGRRHPQVILPHGMRCVEK